MASMPVSQFCGTEGDPEEVAASGMDWTSCLEQVRDGDEGAARALVKQLYPLIIKIVRAHLPKRTAEEDLAQEIYMKLFAKLDQFRGAVPFDHWVSRIALNTCLDHLRSQKVRPELRWADLSVEEADALTAVLAGKEEPHPADVVGAKEIVAKLLDGLSPKDRMIIQWLDLEERSIEDVRGLTGWNSSAIKVRAFRARLKLRKELERLEREEKRRYETGR